jgi:hypothetical protein
MVNFRELGGRQRDRSGSFIPSSLEIEDHFAEVVSPGGYCVRTSPRYGGVNLGEAKRLEVHDSEIMGFIAPKTSESRNWRARDTQLDPLSTKLG